MGKKDALTVPASAPASPAVDAPRSSALSPDTLFGPTVTPDKPAPIIERSFLRNGVVVRYRSTRKVGTHNGGSTIHTFVLGLAVDAPWFSLWGSANLNSQLRKVKAGSVLFVRYAGQATNDDGSAGAHLWDVKPPTASRDVIARFLESKEQRAQMDELTAAIATSLASERERREAKRNGSPDGPPHDDDDFPY